jgi:uncharacterized protein
MGLGLPVIAVADATKLEPGWLKVTSLKLAKGPVRHRFVHFTDVHFKGDLDYLRRVIGTINDLKPDFACFTGDLIEEERFLDGALKELGALRCPLFAIPGNHDHWSNAELEPFAEVCVKTGGAWLQDRQADFGKGGLVLSGVDRLVDVPQPRAGATNILLVHYPGWADILPQKGWDLILAGHTHGGQIRIPFSGPLILPFDSGDYDMGLFQTPAGPLYVNTGIGEFYFRVRFRCRPEITVVEI